MLKLFLYGPEEGYSGGAIGVAADTVEAADLVAAEYGVRVEPGRHYDFQHNEQYVRLDDGKHVHGAHVAGKPRVLFDHTYRE